MFVSTMINENSFELFAGNVVSALVTLAGQAKVKADPVVFVNLNTIVLPSD